MSTNDCDQELNQLKEAIKAMFDFEQEYGCGYSSEDKWAKLRDKVEKLVSYEYPEEHW